MISSKDRSKWFGASDTNKIMGNWETATFRRFWLEKMGVIHSNFTTKEMLAGTYYEHRILDKIGIDKRDRQIKIRRLRLRVNLDGENKDTIYEVKTYKDKFHISQYYGQCQVQMYAAKKRCNIVAYHLLPEDYENFFNEIDESRISFYPIGYDEEYIREYLERLKFLTKCLKRRVFPWRK